MDDLERRFDGAMRELYVEAKRLGYNATYFLRLLDERGGVETARHLVMSEAPAEGFTKLWEMGRLELTVEALILQPPWAELFTAEERLAARKRLESYGWKDSHRTRAVNVPEPDHRPSCRAEEDSTASSVNLDRFAYLHPDGRDLIQGWLERAAETADRDGSFEPFIYLWIAFNGWAACVTGEDRDGRMIAALSADPILRRDFARGAARGSSALGEAAQAFADLWPIFRVEELRQLEVAYGFDPGSDRNQLVARYVAAGAKEFEPRCWVDHEAAGERPVDWPHTLTALYRVRCNLFHGEKARTSDDDQTIVRSACSTLMAFLDEGGYVAH